MQKKINSVNRLYRFLQTHYPVNHEVKLKQYQMCADKSITGNAKHFTDGTSLITLVYGKQSMKDLLQTLAHEWGHIRQFDRKEVFKEGIDWEKEMEACYFSKEAIANFKKYKGD